ncbi:GIY-YIG nuclease family protein [Dehalococcoides mccartyi]|nr:GIY-YIG nuclease family protein [Dehalococcoides mccartyi]
MIQDIESTFLPAERKSYVYILSNHKKAIYVGVTSDLEKRVW